MAGINAEDRVDKEESTVENNKYTCISHQHSPVLVSS